MIAGRESRMPSNIGFHVHQYGCRMRERRVNHKRH